MSIKIMSNENDTNGKLSNHHGRAHSNHTKHTYHAIHKLLTSKGNQHTKKNDESETMRQSIDGSKKSLFHHYHKANIVTDDFATKPREHNVKHKSEPEHHHLKK
jgi:hypothetical protein